MNKWKIIKAISIINKKINFTTLNIISLILSNIVNIKNEDN